jgi:hypothetical protein
MGIFRTSPDRQLSDAIGSRDRLIARLSDAEVAIIACQTKAEQLALSGADDDQLTGAENALRAAQDRRSTLRAALLKSEAEVARLERERADAADRSRREEVGAALELVSRECVESAEEVRAAVDRLYGNMARAATIAPEAGGLTTFAEMARVEIPEGADLIARLVRQNREQVLAGHAPPRMPTLPEPYVEILPPPAPTTTLFALRSIRWIDDAGKRQLVAQYNDAVLPQRLAARALQSGACVAVTDPCRRKLHTQGATPPNPAGAFDLDAPPPEPERSSGELHSAFEVVDRGPTRILQIAR